MWTTLCSVRGGPRPSSVPKREPALPTSPNWSEPSRCGPGGWQRRPGPTSRTRAGAGAAGGTGFAALALLNAELRPGIELLLDWLDFDRALVGADLVITGEGSLDEQSLAGKAPVGVATGGGAIRSDHGCSGWPQPLERRAVAFRGHYPGLPLADLEPDVDKSMANAATLLHEMGQRIASDWLLDSR